MNRKTRTIIFNIAALFVLAGAALYLTKWVVAPYLFAVGTAGIAVCYLTLPVAGMNFRLKRLHRMNILAGLLGIVASALMFAGRLEWVLCLTISAILQVYTSFVSPKEPENEA